MNLIYMHRIMKRVNIFKHCHFTNIGAEFQLYTVILNYAYMDTVQFFIHTINYDAILINVNFAYSNCI
jgi:hypothetical protein